MKKKQAITKALESSDYIGSHRHEIFEQRLKEYGYKIVPKIRDRILDNTQGER